MRTVFLNGTYVLENEAHVSIFDRGFLFGDAVYEVTAVLHGKLIDFNRHMERLERSLRELEMDTISPLPSSLSTRQDYLEMHRELIKRNHVNEGVVYLQITRGTASDRDFHFPVGVPATVVAFTQQKNLINNPLVETGIRVSLLDDLRWGRCDIKTIQLVYQSIAKVSATKQTSTKDGQYHHHDAWLVRDGMITEGTSSSAFIVKNSEIITRPLGNDILHGITRAAVLEIALEAGTTVAERPFSIQEAQEADEAFSTSASTFVLPVVEIGNVTIGNGTPGALTRRLRELYLGKVMATAL